MVNKEKAQNCWDFWGCKVKEKCPAYITDSGRECWLVTNPFNKNSACPNTANRTMRCWDCDWYKKFNPE